MAVTFTNKAAEEMRTRVEALLGTDCRAMWISTFHALCARLLRREAPAIGLSRDFVIYDSSDQLSVVKQMLKESASTTNCFSRARCCRASATRRTAWKARRTSRRAGIRRTARLRSSTPATMRALKEASALDFDDLLLKTVELFDQAPAGPRALRAQVPVRDGRRISGHEPAAVSADQAAASMHRNLAVVGDPDQSIYKWRGADLRNILDFEPDFPDAGGRPARTELPIDQVILDAASAVIANNRNRKEKTLWTDRKGGAKIVSSAAPTSSRRPTTSRASRAALAEDVEHTMAVLYRTNAQSRAIEDGLRQANIAYVVSAASGSTSARRSRTRCRI